MELSFVLSALRRRLWLVALFALLGSLPGLLSDPPTANSYRSVARLNIVQPTVGNVTYLANDPNRYVLSQLSVLESASLVNDVALANGMSITAVRRAVTIEQDPDTDIVQILAEAPDPEQAQSIAASYVSAYMATLDTDRSDTVELDRLEDEINNLRTQLTNLNDAIQQSMEPYLRLLDNRTPPPLPPTETVEPTLVTERDILQAEVSQLIAQRNQLVSESRLRVNTRVTQQATLPTEPVPVGGQFLLAGGLFAGAMLGVVAALAYARFSTKVLDVDTASEILGAPVVTEFPNYRSLSRQPLAAFQALPPTAVPIVDQLCVRAEAKARINEPLTVAVVGSQRNAGTTTLALAMAERFASGGSSVVLIDADVRDPRITAIFNATQDGGVPAVVLNDGALIDQRGRSVFTRTMDPEVSVLGLGSSRGAASLRRDTVASVLEAARRKAQIVVVDGGPALDLASTLQLTAMADAVVLAVPLARQKSDNLSDLSRQLDNVRPKLLPVVTAPNRKPARGETISADGAIGGNGSGRPPQQPGPAIDLTDNGNGTGGRHQTDPDTAVIGGPASTGAGSRSTAAPGAPAPPSGPV